MRYVIKAAACALIALFWALTLIVFGLRELDAVLVGALDQLRAGVAWCDRVAARHRRRDRLRRRRPFTTEDLARRIAAILLIAAGTSVDLAPLINAVIGLAGAVLVAAVPLIVARLRQAGIIKDDRLASALQAAAMAGAQYGINTVQAQLAGKPVTVDMKNQVVAAAAQYLAQHVPDAIAHFGKSDADIAQMILARLDLSGGTVTLTGQQTPPPIPQS